MAPSSQGSGTRIAIVAPSLAGVLRDRSNLIDGLAARGHSVLVVAASHLAGEVAALHRLGSEHRNLDPKPPGMALFAGRKVMKAVREILSAWQAETAIVTGEELASLAATAARKAGAKRVVTIAGGLGADGDGAREAAAAAYKRAGAVSDAIVCHNEDDARALEKVLAKSRAELIVSAGDGVDVETFAAVPLPASDKPVTFLMIADPAARDAIAQYTAAARDLAARGHAAQFHLATDRETADDTALLTAEGVTFHGCARDARPFLAAAHVAVQLSADDGSPTALKQALASGRPVLTLDAGGCREMVDERVNGCLVPPSDTGALAAAMESFIIHRDLLPAESRAARAKAVQAFDRRRVLAPVIAAVEG